MMKQYKKEEKATEARKKVTGENLDGKTSVNHNFRLNLKIGDINKYIEEYQILECEFNHDGRTKTIGEHLKFVSEKRFNLNLHGMEEITRCLFKEQPGFDGEVMPTINILLGQATTVNEFRYVSGISQDIIPCMAENMKWILKNGRLWGDKSAYSNYIAVNNIIEMIERNECNDDFYGFIQPNNDGIVPLDSLKELKKLFDERKTELKVKYDNEINMNISLKKDKSKDDDEYYFQ